MDYGLPAPRCIVPQLRYRMKNAVTRSAATRPCRHPPSFRVTLNRPIISTRGADGRRSLVVNARQKIGPVKSHCNRPILLIISKLRIDLAISRLSDAYCKNTPPDASQHPHPSPQPQVAKPLTAQPQKNSHPRATCVTEPPITMRLPPPRLGRRIL